MKDRTIFILIFYAITVNHPIITYKTDYDREGNVRTKTTTYNFLQNRL
jgi:hypothetical protein